MEAAEQLTAFSAYFLCELHVTQVQLDELYAVLSAVKAGTMSDSNSNFGFALDSQLLMEVDRV